MTNYRSARAAAMILAGLGWLGAIGGAVIGIALAATWAMSVGPAVVRMTNLLAALPMLLLSVGGLVLVVAAGLARAAFDVADKSTRTA